MSLGEFQRYYARAILLAICLFIFFNSARAQRTQQKHGPVKFVDITASAGIKWGLKLIAPGAKYLIETMGGGGGFIDYDGDGLLDIYLICYSQTPQSDPLRDVLYRNNGDGTFTDVTENSGIANSMYGMGLAVGDYNNDGWQDMYISGYRSNKLYRNNGNRTFTDVTTQAGLESRKWGASAAFFDYDNDGKLDLYVCNYLNFDPEEKLPCTFFDNRPYCLIAKMVGSTSALYRNNGNGTFTDVSTSSQISRTNGKGLGVIAFDYDGDRRIDVFQANDTAANFLFRNNGNGTFSEVALEAGVAFDPNGHARGGMGVDAADIDGDGDFEIFVTNFSGETNALFRNDGDGLFTEATHSAGLGQVSIPMSGFGTRFLDYNNDGLIDLFVLNGHPFEPINRIFPETTFAERPILFEHHGKQFREVAGERGEPLGRSYSGRGLATGDIDNDGDPDLLLITVGEAPVLLRNDGGNNGSWLGIKLIGTKSNRDAVGARVTLLSGSRQIVKQVTGGSSYCSASDARLLFGLGAISRVDQVKVSWPSGQVSILKNPAVNKYITVTEAAR